MTPLHDFAQHLADGEGGTEVSEEERGAMRELLEMRESVVGMQREEEEEGEQGEQGEQEAEVPWREGNMPQSWRMGEDEGERDLHYLEERRKTPKDK